MENVREEILHHYIDPIYENPAPANAAIVQEAKEKYEKAYESLKSTAEHEGRQYERQVMKKKLKEREEAEAADIEEKERS